MNADDTKKFEEKFKLLKEAFELGEIDKIEFEEIKTILLKLSILNDIVDKMKKRSLN